MALIGSWNGFDFEISPGAVRGFTGLKIKGGSETEDKVSEKQKYATRKNSIATEISLSVYLNAYMGCNVRDEALNFVNSAMEGAANYFYVGGKKLVTYKLMLTGAEITETEIAANGTWIASKIQLSLKQAEKYPKSSASGGTPGASGASKTPEKETIKKSDFLNKVVSTAKSAATTVVEGAKKAAKAVVAAVTGTKTTKTEKENTDSVVVKAQNLLNDIFSKVNKVTASGKAETKTMKKTAENKKKSASSGVGGGRSTAVLN